MVDLIERASTGKIMYKIWISLGDRRHLLNKKMASRRRGLFYLEGDPSEACPQWGPISARCRN